MELKMVSEDKKKKNHDVDSWSYSGTKKKDFRHSHDGPEVTGPPKPKRNNKKCKRNKGGPHIPGDWILHEHGWAHKDCIYCGKHLEYMWGWGNEDEKERIRKLKERLNGQQISETEK